MANFFKLLVDLGLNASGYEVGLKRVESATHKFGETLNDTVKEKIGELFGAAALEEFARRTIESADNILTLSQRIGVSTDALQEWGYAAKKSGTNLETVEAFLEHIAAAKEKALGGDTAAQGLFHEFGIGVKELGQSADVLAQKIGKAFKSGNVQELIGPLKELGGKGSSALIPIFTEGFDDLAAKAREAGRVLDTELLVRLKEIGEQIKDTFSSSGKGATAIIWFSKQVENIGDFLKMNVGALAAYQGALSGGASKEDAQKAAFGVIDEVMKHREEREKELQKKIEIAKAVGTEAAKEAGKLIYMESGVKPPKEGKELVRQQLTSWQQIGAAVRFNPNDDKLRKIEENTRQTVEKISNLGTAKTSGGDEY